MTIETGNFQLQPSPNMKGNENEKTDLSTKGQHLKIVKKLIEEGGFLYFYQNKIQFRTEMERILLRNFREQAAGGGRCQGYFSYVTLLFGFIEILSVFLHSFFELTSSQEYF